MAGQTIFRHWRMFPEIWSPDFGMAFKAFEVDVLRVNQLVGNGSVRIVAVRAFHFAFTNGMVGLAHQQRSDFLVTAGTKFTLF